MILLTQRGAVRKLDMAFCAKVRAGSREEASMQMLREKWTSSQTDTSSIVKVSSARVTGLLRGSATDGLQHVKCTLKCSILENSAANIWCLE